MRERHLTILDAPRLPCRYVTAGEQLELLQQLLLLRLIVRRVVLAHQLVHFVGQRFGNFHYRGVVHVDAQLLQLGLQRTSTLAITLALHVDPPLLISFQLLHPAPIHLHKSVVTETRHARPKGWGGGKRRGTCSTHRNLLSTTPWHTSASRGEGASRS